MYGSIEHQSEYLAIDLRDPLNRESKSFLSKLVLCTIWLVKSHLIELIIADDIATIELNVMNSRGDFGPE